MPNEQTENKNPVAQAGPAELAGAVGPAGAAGVPELKPVPAKHGFAHFEDLPEPVKFKTIKMVKVTPKLTGADLAKELAGLAHKPEEYQYTCQIDEPPTGDMIFGFYGHKMYPKSDAWITEDLIISIAPVEPKNLTEPLSFEPATEKLTYHPDEKARIEEDYTRLKNGMLCVPSVSFFSAEEDAWFLRCDAEKLGYVFCYHTSQAVKKEKATEVLMDKGEKRYVANQILDDATFIDESNGKRYHRNFMRKFQNGSKYKAVSSETYRNLHSQGLVYTCDHCSHGCFVPAPVLDEDGAEVESPEYAAALAAFNNSRCLPCNSKLINKNLIKPYNHKQKPKFLVSKSRDSGYYVLGHEVGKDGLIYSTGKKAAKENIRYFGAEMEVEIDLNLAMKKKTDRFHICKDVLSSLGEDFVYAKEDGTLLHNGHYANSAKDPSKNKPTGPQYAGFEVVTNPADIHFHRLRWPNLLGCESFPLLRAWDYETCGFHVHVGRASLSDLQIGRMLRFINHKNNARFIHKVAGRGSDKFCAYHDKNIVDVRHPDRVVSLDETGSGYDRGRRVALNISNRDTVEFRIFRGTCNPKHIIRNIEFCDAVADFCWLAERSFSELDDYSYFIRFIGNNIKRWPLFAAWLVYQKQLSIKKIKEGVDQSKLTIQPDMVVEPTHPTVDYSLQEINKKTKNKAKKGSK